MNANVVSTWRRHVTLSLSPPHHNPPATASADNRHDPYSLLKKDPIQICSSMWVKAFSCDATSSVPNLTGFLSKFDLWVLAYQRSCAHVTGTFPPRSAVHAQILHELLSLRNTVVYGRFTWNEKIQPFVRSPNDKRPGLKSLSKRKLQSLLDSDEPCFQDQVVQEVLLMILEPVFESRFSPKSQAFRPNRNAHTAIRTIRTNFAGYLWFVRGDLSDVLVDLDRNAVMNCLAETVRDTKVLGLVKSVRRTRVRVQIPVDSDAKAAKRKKKKGATKKMILNENEPKPRGRHIGIH